MNNLLYKYRILLNKNNERYYLQCKPRYFRFFEAAVNYEFEEHDLSSIIPLIGFYLLIKAFVLLLWVQLDIQLGFNTMLFLEILFFIFTIIGYIFGGRWNFLGDEEKGYSDPLDSKMLSILEQHKKTHKIKYPKKTEFKVYLNV